MLDCEPSYSAPSVWLVQDLEFRIPVILARATAVPDQTQTRKVSKQMVRHKAKDAKTVRNLILSPILTAVTAATALIIPSLATHPGMEMGLSTVPPKPPTLNDCIRNSYIVMENVTFRVFGSCTQTDLSAILKKHTR